MIKNLTVFIVLLISTGGLKAQEVVAPAGGQLAGDTKSISWTLGELVTATFSAEDLILTQGFHQSALTITTVEEIPGMGFGIAAYPNPATDFVTISLKELPSEATTFGLYDFSGRKLLSGELVSREKTLSFGSMDSGVYFLRISRGSQHVKTFKIVKQ